MNCNRYLLISLSMLLPTVGLTTFVVGAAQESKSDLIETDRGIFYKFLRVKEISSLTSISAQLRENDKKLELQLADVLPLSKWPMQLTAEQNKFKEMAIGGLKDLLLSESAYEYDFAAYKGRDGLQGDLCLWHKKWNGQGPSEEVGRGIILVNIRIVEEGWSVYAPSTPKLEFLFDSTIKSRSDLLRAAEEKARESKKGVWQDRVFAEKLKEIAKSKS